VIFSTEDPVFPPAVGERWVERLSSASELTLIDGAGHFLQEDRGDAVAAAVISFLDA
jgi:haloalkane dehalogenase